MDEVEETGQFQVDSDTLIRLRQLADAEGLPLEMTFKVVLRGGLKLSEQGRVDRALGYERALREIDEVRTAVHALGPAVLGTNLLLTHWATTSGSIKVTAEELEGEFRKVAQMAWALEMTKRGIIPIFGREPQSAAADTAAE